MASNYAGGQYREYTLMLRQRIAELPSFCAEFFRGIENETLVRTRYAYAGDLRNFFRYITTELPDLKGKCILELTLADLDRISVTEIEMYLAHVSYYMDEEHREIINQDRAKARKLSTLRAFYKYFCKKEKLKNNPPSLVDLPTIREKAIIRLEPNEVADLLDVVQKDRKSVV